VKDELWAEERLRTLNPSTNWRPNAGAAFAKLRSRDRRRVWQRRCGWSLAMATGLVVAVVAVPAPAKCALLGVGCMRTAITPALLLPAATANPSPPTAAPVLKPDVRPAVVKKELSYKDLNYKDSGSLSAPIVCEIYADYECPSCAAFYTAVFPQFVADYVSTGRVRVRHRDFPLPQHPFARLAARYANAAGELGHYDEVMQRLFTSQSEWAANGNVDAAVASVLPDETMRKLRSLVRGDPKLDATLADDLLMVGRDQIDQTPTIVFVYKGIRRKVSGAPSFDLIRRYVENMLTR
jgi:protein-disulfide isomerase